jgi:hypothetical protein
MRLLDASVVVAYNVATPLEKLPDNPLKPAKPKPAVPLREFEALTKSAQELDHDVPLKVHF